MRGPRGRAYCPARGDVRFFEEDASGSRWMLPRGVHSPRTAQALDDDAQLLAPVAPGKIVCVGRNYRAHAAELGNDVPAEPKLFLKPPSSVIGPGATIVRPAQSDVVHYEGELALVMGQRCTHTAVADALTHVAFATCANDVTARDLQRRDGAFTRAKGFDTFCALGPMLVPLGALPDLGTLVVRTRLNGDLRQEAPVSDMVFSPAELIAFISAVMTLEPGDVVLTGTPAGVGELSAGDRVSVEVDHLPHLVNPVEDAGA